MSKYDNANTVGEMQVIDAYLDPMEYVFWRGRGNKLAYIITNSMAMAPFAIIWLFFDAGFIATMFGGFAAGGEGVPKEVLMFVIPFFAIHLLPVWIWLGGMLKSAKKWKESAYVITDKQIIIKNASTGMNVTKYKYDTIVTVKVHRGFWDKILGTSDLQFYLTNGMHIDILDIKGVDDIYQKVKQRIEETPCVRELHTNNVEEDIQGHVCKDYPTDFNPYDK